MRLNASGAKSENDAKTYDAERPVPGRYLCYVTDCRERQETSSGEKTIINLEVLGGTVPGQEKKEIALFLKFKDDGSPSQSHLVAALALGLLEGGTDADIDFEADAPGKMLVCEVEEWSKGSKSGVSIANWGNSIWNPRNPDVADVMAVDAVQAAFAKYDSARDDDWDSV